MKLYYAPGACSLAPHIVFEELHIPFGLVQVDLKKKTLQDGSDYTKINPLGAVPLLECEDLTLIRENAVILQYLAAQKPHLGLAIAQSEEDHWEFLSWLNFVATEMHKGFGPLLHSDTPEAYKEIVKKKLSQKFRFLSMELRGKVYLMGKRYTVADAYLFTILNWAPKVKIDLSEFHVLSEYILRVKARPATQKALSAEGLLVKEKVVNPLRRLVS